MDLFVIHASLLVLSSFLIFYRQLTIFEQTSPLWRRRCCRRAPEVAACLRVWSIETAEIESVVI